MRFCLKLSARQETDQCTRGRQNEHNTSDFILSVRKITTSNQGTDHTHVSWNETRVDWQFWKHSHTRMFIPPHFTAFEVSCPILKVLHRISMVLSNINVRYKWKSHATTLAPLLLPWKATVDIDVRRDIKYDNFYQRCPFWKVFFLI